MAAKIEVGLSTYLIDFTGGQAGLRTPPYVQYSPDHDTNYVTLRNTVNTLIDEVNAVQGPNAGLGVDILVFDDPDRADSGEPNDAAGANTTGFVGVVAFEPAFATTSTADDSVAVDPGVVIISALAVRNSNGATLVGSGGAGSRWVAIDANATLFLEIAPGQQAADLWEVNWNGSAFTGAFTRQQQVFFDGDEYEAMRDRPASAPTFAANRFEAFSERMLEVEQALAGLGGSLGLPNGSAGSPSLFFQSDQDTGVYRVGADQLGITTNGVLRLTVANTLITAAQPVRTPNGVVGAAGLQVGSAGVGLHSPGGNRLAMGTGSTLGLEVDAQQYLDLPTNARVKGVRTAAQNIADATATLVDFNATDAFDVATTGQWHDAGSGTLSDREEFTVPTDGNGLYHIVFAYEWADPVNLADFLMEVTVNGTAIQEVCEHDSERNHAGQLAAFVELVATDVVRARVTQNDTVAANALDLERATLSIVKVA